MRVGRSGATDVEGKESYGAGQPKRSLSPSALVQLQAHYNDCEDCERKVRPHEALPCNEARLLVTMQAPNTKAGAQPPTAWRIVEEDEGLTMR